MRQAVRREGPLLPYAQFHQNPQLSKEETHLMLMVMDIGNTNIVVGVHDGKEWIAHWRLSSSRSRTSDEFGIILGSMFQAGGVDMKAVKDIIVSTVVPPLLVPLCNMCKRYFGITPFVVTSNCNTGLKALTMTIPMKSVRTVSSMRWLPTICMAIKATSSLLTLVRQRRSVPSVLMGNIWVVPLLRALAFQRKPFSKSGQAAPH